MSERSITIISQGSGYEAHEELVKRVARAIGCIDADRCNGRVPSGSCADCLSVAQDVLKEIFRSPQTGHPGPFNCPPLDTRWEGGGEIVEPFSWQGGYVWVRFNGESRLWAYDEFWAWALKVGAKVTNKESG